MQKVVVKMHLELGRAGGERVAAAAAAAARSVWSVSLAAPPVASQWRKAQRLDARRELVARMALWSMALGLHINPMHFHRG